MKSVNIVIKNSIRIFMKNGLLWTKKKKAFLSKLERGVTSVRGWEKWKTIKSWI